MVTHVHPIRDDRDRARTGNAGGGRDEAKLFDRVTAQRDVAAPGDQQPARVVAHERTAVHCRWRIHQRVVNGGADPHRVARLRRVGARRRDLHARAGRQDDLAGRGANRPGVRHLGPQQSDKAAIVEAAHTGRDARARLHPDADIALPRHWSGREQRRVAG